MLAVVNLFYKILVNKFVLLSIIYSLYTPLRFSTKRFYPPIWLFSVMLKRLSKASFFCNQVFVCVAGIFALIANVPGRITIFIIARLTFKKESAWKVSLSLICLFACDTGIKITEILRPIHNAADGRADGRTFSWESGRARRWFLYLLRRPGRPPTRRLHRELLPLHNRPLRNNWNLTFLTI